MNKKTFAMIGLLAVLVIVAFLVMEKPGERSTTLAEQERVFDVDSAVVDRIEVSGPGSSLVLVKQGSDWFLERPLQYRADQSQVTSLIQQLRDLRAGAVVSSNPEKQSLFEVDSSGTRVILSGQGKEQASLVIGKMGNTYAETYVRRGDEDDVLLTNASLSAVRTRALKDWRDRIIAEVPRDNITSVDFQYGDTTFTLTFRDSVWRVGDAVVQNWAVSSLLSGLSELRADDFVDAPPRPMPKVSAMLRYSGVEVRFAKPTGRDVYFVQSSSGPQWYEMQDWRANQILKRKKDLTQK